ncbi:hypothetical protein NMG60_11001392 [Bertholletia excelsa]
MEFHWYSVACLIFPLSITLLVVLLFLLQWTKASSGNLKKRPPGPAGWPVVGNMFGLGAAPHQSLHELRFKYGPVLWLQLGSINTVVIQSANAAAEFFKNHDLTFSDRKVPDALTALDYNKGSLAIGKYGTYWRIIRRICTVELLVNKRINESVALRQKCIDNMVSWIEQDVAKSHMRGEPGELEICHFLFLMAFNIMGNLMLSRDLLDPQSDEGHEFFDAMKKFTSWAGKPNVADFLPFLKWLDPQGIKRSMVRETGRTMKIIAEFVTERIQQRQVGMEKANKDFLDVLLDYEGDGKEGPEKLSERNVTIIILEMFFAGSETTSSTIEWAMAELLRWPDAMKNVKEEIDRVVPNRKVEESDIDRLPYLQAVVKETLRLHPALPLLIPRNSMEDSNYMGYYIPKNTQVFVNAWAIGRDPESWNDPLSFKPERFLGIDIEYKGQHFDLIPFGSGRRSCIGYSLAHRVLHLALATLLQSFNWELSGSVTPETMDMRESVGISVRKLIPIKVIPKKRIGGRR